MLTQNSSEYDRLLVGTVQGHSHASRNYDVDGRQPVDIQKLGKDISQAPGQVCRLHEGRLQRQAVQHLILLHLQARQYE